MESIRGESINDGFDISWLRGGREEMAACSLSTASEITPRPLIGVIARCLTPIANLFEKLESDELQLEPAPSPSLWSVAPSEWGSRPESPREFSESFEGLIKAVMEEVSQLSDNEGNV